MNLNPEQTAVVESLAKLITVVAGPGSGKSRTLVARIERVVRDGVDPQRIAAITFTNQAAAELAERLQIRLGFVGTLHGLMLNLLRLHHNRVGYSSAPAVLNEIQALETLNEVRAQLKAKSLPVSSLKQLCGSVLPKDKPLSKEEAVAATYQQRLRDELVVDYDGILRLGLELLQMGGVMVPEHLFVDEVQDSCEMDALIYETMPATTKFFVGDQDQCQPPGTMVAMSDGSVKPIEAVVPGDSVVGYERHSKVLLRGVRVSGVSSRPFQGLMYAVTAGGKSTEATGNHRWLIKWKTGAARSGQEWATYLMRRGDWFRVGKTKFFRSSKLNHVLGITTRFNQERADAAWILKIHPTEAEATGYEQVVAATYGLPEACFEPASNARQFTRNVIDYIFQSIPSQLVKALRCLSAHGRELEHPLLDRSSPRTRRTVQVVRSCNLLSEVMSVPVPATDGSRGTVWTPLSVSAREFTGTVHSLGIEKHPYYIANGVVTGNSIYQFRGGSDAFLKRLCFRTDAALFKLEDNYRCGTAICAAANHLIQFNQDRVPKVTVSCSGASGAVTVDHYEGQPQEAAAIAAKLTKLNESGVLFEDCAVLVRGNAVADAYGDMLVALGIPVKRRRPTIVDSEWVKAMTILSLCANPENDRLVVEFYKFCRSPEELAALRRRAAESLGTLAEAAHLLLPAAQNIEGAFRLLVESCVSASTVDLVAAVGGTLPATAEISDLVCALAAGPGDREAGQGVTVGTIHSAKGREWSHVFMPAFEQGVIPAKRDIAPERCLAFVGITRAKHGCHISHAATRPNVYKRITETAEPSQFIKEAGL